MFPQGNAMGTATTYSGSDSISKAPFLLSKLGAPFVTGSVMSLNHPSTPSTRAPCMLIREAGPGQQRQAHSTQDCQGQDVNITKGTAVKMVLTNCFSSNTKGRTQLLSLPWLESCVVSIRYPGWKKEDFLLCYVHVVCMHVCMYRCVGSHAHGSLRLNVMRLPCRVSQLKPEFTNMASLVCKLTLGRLSNLPSTGMTT